MSAAAPDAGGSCDSPGEGLVTAGGADDTGDVEVSAVGARLGAEDVGGSTADDGIALGADDEVGAELGASDEAGAEPVTTTTGGKVSGGFEMNSP